MLQAKQTGEEAYQKFRSECFESESPTAKFHDKMKKLNLKSFSTTKKGDGVDKAKNKELVLKADRNLFGHMIIAAQSRDLHIQDVLAHYYYYYYNYYYYYIQNLYSTLFMTKHALGGFTLK